MKKPSKSPTVLLKQKVKERILTKGAGKVGKSEGPSTTSGEEIPADSDVQAAKKSIFGRLMEQAEKGEMPDGVGFNYADAISMKPVLDKDGKPFPKGTFLPVEHHGTVNDLARQVIFSKVRKKQGS